MPPPADDDPRPAVARPVRTPTQDRARENRLARQGESDAFGALGLVLSGVLVWGGVGFLVSAWLDSTLFTMFGLLLGMFAGLFLVWFRYGRAA